MLEHLAGIVCGGRDTFLFRDGVFRAVNEILRGALDAHNGEETERNGEDLIAGIAGKSSVQAVADRFGKIIDVDTAGMAMAFAGISDLRIQNDGVNDFKNGSRQIGSGIFRMAASAEILRADLTAEDIDVALTAVKDDLLFDDGNAVDLLRSAETDADLCRDLDIHGDADLIESAVKGYAVHVDIGAKNLCAFRAHVACTFDHFARTVGKIDADVLKAVLVTAAVKDAVGVYIYRFAAAAAIRRGISGIRHNDNHSFHKMISLCEMLAKRNFGQSSKIPLAISYATGMKM